MPLPNKAVVYGEAHLIMAVRETIVELKIEEDGSGLLTVNRNDKQITHIEWEPEKSVVIDVNKLDGFAQREKETI